MMEILNNDSRFSSIQIHNKAGLRDYATKCSVLFVVCTCVFSSGVSCCLFNESHQFYLKKPENKHLVYFVDGNTIKEKKLALKFQRLRTTTY